LDDEFHFVFDCEVTGRPSFIDFMKTKYPLFNLVDSLEKLKIIVNPDKEILPSVCNFIKQSLAGSNTCTHKHKLTLTGQCIYIHKYN
jgi:hypothetical protein